MLLLQEIESGAGISVLQNKRRIQESVYARIVKVLSFLQIWKIRGQKEILVQFREDCV